jgi:hypothetical protein
LAALFLLACGEENNILLIIEQEVKVEGLSCDDLQESVCVCVGSGEGEGEGECEGAAARRSAALVDCTGKDIEWVW